MSYASQQNMMKVNADTKEWHKRASKVRSEMSVPQLVDLAQYAIDAGIYNKDFGHQAAGIIGWYHETGSLTSQQVHALSYFVVPFLQHRESSSAGQWAKIEDAVLAVQNGLTNSVRVTERTVVRAVHGGVNIEIQNRVNRVVL